MQGIAAGRAIGGTVVSQGCTIGAVPRVVKLTARAVEEAPPAPPGRSYYLMDAGLPGFGVRVYASSRAWIVRYRRRTVQLAPVYLVPLAVARREGAALLLELRGARPGLQAGGRWTVAELAERVAAEHYAVRLAPASRRLRALSWRRHLLPRFGAVRVADLRRDQVQAMMRELAGEPAAANVALAALSHAFGLAELWDPPWRAPGTNPCRGVTPHASFPRSRVLSPEEYRRLWEALDVAEREEMVPLEVVALVRFLMLTGCRPGEAIAARWEQVEVVERAGADGAPRFTGRLVLPVAKGDRAGRRRGRVVWLSALAVEVLRELEPAPGSGLVFPPPAGRRDMGRVLRGCWAVLCELAGLGRDVVPYTLRHSYVTEGDAAEVSLAVMADLAGHARVATTDGVYRHGRESAQLEGAERMGRHLERMIRGGRADGQGDGEGNG